MNLRRSARIVTGTFLSLGLFAPVRAACTPDGYESDDACIGSRAVLHNGESEQHGFCQGPTDWIGFNAIAGGSYVLTTSDLAASADTVIELYGPDCVSLLASDDNGGGGRASRVVWTAAADGTYHVKVRQADGTVGDNRDYTVALSGNTSVCETSAKVFMSDIGAVTATDLQQLHDGGFAGVGEVWLSPANADFLLLRLDPGGNVTWHKSYGGPISEEWPAIQELPDGGFVVAGVSEDRETWANSGGVVLRIAPAGGITWQTRFGDTDDSLDSVAVTSDGSILAAGKTYSFGSGFASDAWVMKLNGNGAILWSKRYGGSDSDWASSVVSMPDGSFVFAGGMGDNVVWIVRLASDGSILWQKRYSQANRIFWALALADSPGGDLFVGGFGRSLDWTDYETLWIAKLDSSGNLLWERNLDVGPLGDIARSVRATADGGCLVTGDTATPEPDRSFANWIAKFDATGGLVWQRLYDYRPTGQLSIGQQTADGGYAVVTGGTGLSFLRLDADGGVTSCDVLGSSPPTSVVQTTVVSATSGSVRNYAPTTAGAGFVATDVSVTPATLCRRHGPTYVGTLGVAKGLNATMISWTADPASPFDLVRGDLGTLRNSNGDFTAALDAILPTQVCLAHDTSGLEADDLMSGPSPGAGYFYVLRGVRLACAGTYNSVEPSQSADRDPGIAAAADTCP